jgi:plastocyanin
MGKSEVRGLMLAVVMTTSIAGCPGPDATLEGGMDIDAGPDGSHGDGGPRDAGHDGSIDASGGDTGLGGGDGGPMDTGLGSGDTGLGSGDTGLGDGSTGGGDGSTGLGDGSTGGGDGGVVLPDASAMLDATAPLDGSSAVDAFTDDVSFPDAFVGVDAFVPDAFVPDAFVPMPDAFVPMPDAATEAPVNGCTRATATDLTGRAGTTITFTFASYSPPCIRVSVGTIVTFNGSFASHPLNPGTVVGTTVTPDVGSPIMTTSSGSTASFTMSSVRTNPYYCGFHYTLGMVGAIYVE